MGSPCRKRRPRMARAGLGSRTAATALDPKGLLTYLEAVHRTTHLRLRRLFSAAPDPTNLKIECVNRAIEPTLGSPE